MVFTFCHSTLIPSSCLTGLMPNLRGDPFTPGFCENPRGLGGSIHWGEGFVQLSSFRRGLHGETPAELFA